MKFDLVPMYCGGLLLKGLYNPHPGIPDKDLYNFCMKIGPYGVATDPYPYVPNELKWFQRIMWDNVRWSGRTNPDFHPFVGVVIAVTNTAQNVAAEHLEKTGFVKTGTYSKNGLNAFGRVSDSGKCFIWHGDWHKDVMPILIENEKKNFPLKPVEVKPAKFSPIPVQTLDFI